MNKDQPTSRDGARITEPGEALPQDVRSGDQDVTSGDREVMIDDDDVRVGDDRETPMMFVSDEAAGYRTRWNAVQTGFVDDPRRAVEEADALVAQVIQRLSEVFADERTTLEGQWDRGGQVSTEDLRVALQRYRSFFERLLSR